MPSGPSGEETDGQHPYLQARDGGRRTRRPTLTHDGGSEVGAGGHDPLGRRTLRVIGVRYDDDEPNVLIVEEMSK
jgi:hypothetical protein